MRSIKKDISFEVLSIFITAYPFLVLPWNIYYITITKLIYLVAFTAVLWCVFILQWKKDKRPLFLPQTNGEKLSLLFLFFICLATVFAKDPKISFWGDLFKYQGLMAWFGYITIFLFFCHLIPINKQVKVIQLMVYASAFCGIYGIIQHFYLNLLVGKKTETEFVRSWAFFDHANHFGSYLVIMMILGMTMYLLAEGRRQCIIHLVIICTLFISLLYTTTRGAWIAVFIGGLLLTILVVWKRRSLWKRWLLLLMSLFIALQIANVLENNLLFERLLSLGSDVSSLVSSDNGEAGSGRWGIWKRTFPIIQDNYLLGTGPNSFSIVFPRTDFEIKTNLDNSHNDYIEIAMTMGIPALLAYLAFIFTILKSSFSAVKKLERDEEIYLYGLITTLVCYLIKVFFNISVVPVAPFFWALLGMCYSFSMKYKTISD